MNSTLISVNVPNDFFFFRVRTGEILKYEIYKRPNDNFFFGHMDYFLNMASHTNGAGLSDLYAYLGYKVSDNISLKNTTHFFSLAQTNSTTPEDKALGLENEVELKYRFNKWGMIKAGWLFYVPTDSFRQLQGVADERFPNFAFVELTITSSLLEN